MAYRNGPTDVRTSGLIAVVATHDQLVVDHRRVQREHDEVARQVDALGHRLVAVERERERTGLLVALKRWIGIAHPAALQREACEIRRVLAERTEQLARIALRVKTIATRLADVEAARLELARLEQARGGGGASDGPASTAGASTATAEARRHDEDELAVLDEQIAALAQVGRLAERCDSALAGLRDVLATSARGGHSIAGRPIAPPLAPRAPDDPDRELREQLGLVRDELRVFRDAFVACELTADPATRLALAELVALIAAPVAEPPGRSELAAAIERAHVWVTRLVGAANDERTVVSGRRASIAQRTMRR